MYQPHAASSRMIGRFSPAAHAPPDGQGFLPGFGEEVVTPALPLVLYELGVNDPQNPGAGAPVALRIFVESILAMPLGQQCAELSIPARTMIARLYPHRPPTAKEWDAAIETARAALASPEAGIQWNGKRQWAVWLHTIPTTLDGDIGIRVNLPEGSDTGPQVSKRLHLYGPKQGRHYRALLNLAYWWHEPGRTLIPAGKGKSHWLQVDDPKRYRKLSDAEIVNIVFPKSASKRRRNLLSRAARTIADLRDDGELRIVAGKLLPPLKPPPPHHDSWCRYHDSWCRYHDSWCSNRRQPAPHQHPPRLLPLPLQWWGGRAGARRIAPALPAPANSASAGGDPGSRSSGEETRRRRPQTRGQWRPRQALRRRAPTRPPVARSALAGAIARPSPIARPGRSPGAS